MFEPRGMIVTELGDLDVFVHENRFHLLHLTLPNHDSITHLVSDDGLSWDYQPPVLETGAPGAFDDDMIWTMHCVRHPQGKGFHLYYTGCARAELGNHQRVGVALTDDLIHYRKHPGNPIFQPSAPHYLDTQAVNGMVACRDPFVMYDEGQWHMFVTMRTAAGPRFRRGCVGHAVSDDGIAWRAVEPLLAPQCYEDLEVISVLKHQGWYYLTFHDFNAHTHYRMARSLAGPWLSPPRDEVLPTHNWVFRFCQWEGRPLLLHNMAGECDWRRRSAAGGYKVASPPREIIVHDDGTLALGSYRGWAKYHDGEVSTLPGAELAGAGQQLQLHEPELSDFVLETTVTLQSGRAAGLLLRSDAGVETCLWLRLDYDRQQVSLHTHSPYDSAQDRIKLKQRVVQSFAAKLEYGNPVAVKVLACKQYVEVSLDGEIHLCPLTYLAKRGRCGMFVEDGQGAFTPARVQPLRCPWPVWEKA